MEHVAPDTALGRLLDASRAQAASDLHGQAGKPWHLRVHGRLTQLDEAEFPVPDADALAAVLAEAFSPEFSARIRTGREVDAAFRFRTDRYRANFSKQLGAQSFSFRIVPQQQAALDALQLPPSLRGILDEPRGLVLLTGPTGQGKSTTARALLQELNLTRALRIITIEDPVEYVFTDARSQFEQREVGLDTAAFADGIRNAMRQDPNVIFIGEIRDRESIWAGMQAAETGHLVVTTLHADSVPQALARIREYYPASEQPSVSALLARNLNAIVCQRLLPNVSGGRTPCVELLRRDAGVQDAIAGHQLDLLAGLIEASVHVGMHSFDQYLLELLAAGVITRETAQRYAVNRHALDLQLRGIVTQRAILRPDAA
ncbi:MAG TPA: ATPase, T2SS/T4P/T4SS family [Verrucomicrobiota bacterium]|nr:ATPase, T2SS/T4P/T4SS family [Verrucomicrobiota bacterium]